MSASFPPPPVARLVLLGASNLRMSLPAVLKVASSSLGTPLEIFVAHGHGRSYGATSSIPGRTLPGILPCHLWNDFATHPSLPTFALLTDIGNDLLYGVAPAELLDWIEECVVRLTGEQSSLVVTQLPMESVWGLNEARYKIFRQFFFPFCRVSLATILDRAQQTNAGLRVLAERYGFSLPAMQKTWYGVDLIHLRRRSRLHAWRSLLASWQTRAAEQESLVFPVKQRVLITLAAPDERRLLGWRQRRAQPAIRLPDGSTIGFY